MRRFWLSWMWAATVCIAGCGDDGQNPGDAGMDAGDQASEAGIDGGNGDPSGMDAGVDAGGSIPDAGPDVHADGALPDGAVSDGGVDGACPQGAAGTPPEDYLALFRSGSRLQARVFSAEGMPDVFAGFYDTQLDVPCDFVRATDGEWRCLPRSASVDLVEGYMDAACSRVLVRASPSCSTQKGYRRTPTQCSDVYEARELEPLSETTSRYATGSCEALEDVGPADDRFAAGEPLDLGMFVQGSLVELPGACEASVRVMEGEDGSRAAFELFDVATGLGCRARDRHCSPSEIVAADPTLHTSDTCGDLPTLGVSPDPAECRAPAVISPGMEDGYRWVDGVYEGEVYSSLDDCRPVGVGDQGWYVTIGTLYTAGDAFAVESLAFFDGAMEGTGRLQVQVLSEAGKPLMTATSYQEPRLYDTQREGSCVPLLFEDGARHCVMSDWARGGIEPNYYEDAACERPLHQCIGDDCAGSVHVDQAVDDGACATRAPVSGIWVLREPAEGSSYYRKDGTGTCYHVTEPVPPNRWLADAFDVSQLATLELRTLE